MILCANWFLNSDTRYGLLTSLVVNPKYRSRYKSFEQPVVVRLFPTSLPQN